MVVLLIRRTFMQTTITLYMTVGTYNVYQNNFIFRHTKV